jgi:ABC-type dipeptide/oligopeptide/nickel transport system ATPase subunit
MLANLIVHKCERVFQKIDLSFWPLYKHGNGLKRVAAIYGANAAGKSTVVAEMGKLQTLLTYPAPNLDIELVISHECLVYAYFIQTNANGEIEWECLKAIDRDIETTVFERDLAGNIAWSIPKAPSAIYAKAPVLKLYRTEDKLKIIYDWLNKLRVRTSDGLYQDLHAFDWRHPNLKEIEFLKALDIEYDSAKLDTRKLSAGEVKLYALAAITTADVTCLVIDDLDANLHPLVVKRFITYCQERGIQLIFTTHSTHLLNTLDPEDVWFVAKGKLFSLVEFQLAGFKGSIERGYLDGRFGAVPIID